MTNYRIDSFDQAIKNLQLLPLVTEEDIKRFRVEYGEEVLKKLRSLVTHCANDNKIIFTGHRGSGKSTLLGKFALDMQRKSFIVFFSIADLIELSDVNHINILFAMAVKLMEEAETKKVKIDFNTKKAFYNWFSKHTKIESSEVTYKGEIETSGQAGIDAWFMKFFAKIKAVLQANKVVRDEIKTEFAPKISDLVDRINDIANAIQAATGKEILVIIDDLDKLNLPLVESLYVNNINVLFQPQFRIVYTIPMAAIKEKNVRGVIRNATNNPIISMWATKFFSREDYSKDNAVPNPKAVKVFEEVLYKRIHPSLIAEDVTQALILKSGGALRELIRLGSYCCRYCLQQLEEIPDESEQEVIITDDILQKAVRDLRIEFTEYLGKEDYEVLVQVNNDQEPLDSNDQIFLDLLHGLNILEYRNDDLWFGLHPIVKDIVERRSQK